jgi:hypothetical protein
VSLTIELGELQRYYSEGANPTPWEKEDATFETDVPEYRDFTRYRRRYPTIAWRFYREVRARVFIRFPDGLTFEREYTFWRPEGNPQTSTNLWFYRWRRTSGIEIGDPPGRWKDATIPEGWDRYREPEYDDDHVQRRRPPDDHLRMIQFRITMPRFLPGSPGWGWNPVERHSLSAGLEWVPGEEPARGE